MNVSELLHKDGEIPKQWMRDGFLLCWKYGCISLTEIYCWDAEEGEFYGNIRHHVSPNDIYGWIYIGEIEGGIFADPE